MGRIFALIANNALLADKFLPDFVWILMMFRAVASLLASCQLFIYVKIS